MVVVRSAWEKSAEGALKPACGKPAAGAAKSVPPAGVAVSAVA